MCCARLVRDSYFVNPLLARGINRGSSGRSGIFVSEHFRNESGRQRFWRSGGCDLLFDGFNESGTVADYVVESAFDQCVFRERPVYQL